MGRAQSVMSEPPPPSEAPPQSLPGATVLQIVPALDESPIAFAAVDVAHALLRSGARAIVAGRDGPLVSSLQRLGGEWIHLETTSRNPLRTRAAASSILDLVAAERIDVVHARGGGALAAAGAIGAKHPAWLVASELHSPSPLRADHRSKRIIRSLPRVIAASKHLARCYAERFGVAEKSLVVIPPRVDIKRFDCAAVSHERAAVLRRSWKIEPEERLILVPGRLDPKQGQINVVDAARLLSNGGLRKAVFVMAGDDQGHADYARAIAERARDHGVAHLVRLISVCADMPAAYAAADYIVIPAVEPPAIALSAAEACAMARPVVASDSGALPEIVRAPPFWPEHMRTGWLVKPDDSWALARAMATALATEASAYCEMADRSRRLATALFAPERVAAATLEVYTSLLEGRA